MSSLFHKITASGLIVAMGLSPLAGLAEYAPGNRILNTAVTRPRALSQGFDVAHAKNIVSRLTQGDSPQERRLLMGALDAFGKATGKTLSEINSAEDLIELMSKFVKDNPASQRGSFNLLRGHLAENIAHQELAKSGLDVKFTKASSMSSDLHYRNQTGGRFFQQVKVCNKTTDSLSGVLEDALQFRANKPGKEFILKYEGVIPKNQFKELIARGEIDVNGNIINPQKWVPRLFQSVKKHAESAPFGPPNTLTKAGRYAFYQTEEQIRSAISSVKIKPLPLNLDEINGKTASIINKTPVWIKNLQGLMTRSGNTASTPIAARTMARMPESASKILTTARNASAAANLATKSTKLPVMQTVSRGLTGIGALITVGCAAHEHASIESDYEQGKITYEERARRHGVNAATASLTLATVAISVVCPFAGAAIMIITWFGHDYVDKYVYKYVGEWYAERARAELEAIKQVHVLRIEAIGEFNLSPEEYEKSGHPEAACLAYRALYAKHHNKQIPGVIFIETDTLELHRAKIFTQEAISL